MPTMRKFDVLTVAVVVVALLACKKTEKQASAEPSAVPAVPAAIEVKKPPTPDVVVPVSTLLTDYKGNEIAADAKYKGKWVKVTGKVGDIKKDIADQAYLTLGTGQELEIPMAQAFFGKDDETLLAKVSKRSEQTVLCRCEGLMMNVLLRDCTFAAPE